MGQETPGMESSGRNERSDGRSVNGAVSTARDRASFSAVGIGIGSAGVLGGAPEALVAAETLATYGLPTVPLQTPAEFGTALCEIGVGAAVTIVLYVIAMALLVGAMVMSGFWFFDQRSKSGGRQKGSGSNGAAAGMMAFGALVVAGSPTLLAGAGFTPLSCIDAINIFGGGTGAIVSNMLMSALGSGVPVLV